MKLLAALALLAAAGCATTAAPQRDFFANLSALLHSSGKADPEHDAVDKMSTPISATTICPETACQSI